MTKVDSMLPEHIRESLAEVENESDCEVNMERVPFSKNTMHNDLKRLNLLITNNKVHMEVMQNKENVSETLSEQSDISETIEVVQIDRSCTPANDCGPPIVGPPLTPTANLKVLFNAMSPELRNREIKVPDIEGEEVEIMNEDLIGQPMVSYESVPPMPVPVVSLERVDASSNTSSSQDIDLSKYGSRKEKSLGLLCQKFLQKYPEYPKSTEQFDICLDEVAKELQVERRRIYDIVNVLESVEIVSRKAKNKYAWHGKTNLQTTLAKLKALGESEGFGEQIQKLKDYEMNRELEEQLGRYAPKANPESSPDYTVFGESSFFNQALRKDKSLGIMSQKFLMLFLVSQPKTVNLDLSAKLLIGDANIDKTENAKFKTKIRRLYDIANILTSLELIRKVHVTEIRGRKPAFKYIGPDIDNNEELHICCTDGCHRPSSRHSMLDCIQNQNVANIMTSYRPIKPSGKIGMTTTGKKTIEIDTSDNSKSKFGRHSSFEQICAVAEHERNKLYASEPTSPTEKEPSQEFAKELEKMSPRGQKVSAKPDSATVSKPFILMQCSGDGQFRIVEETEDSKASSAVETEKGLPTKGFVRKKGSLVKSSGGGQFRIVEDSEVSQPAAAAGEAAAEATEKGLPTKGFVRKKGPKVHTVQSDSQMKVQTVTTSTGRNTKISSGTETIIIKTTTKGAGLNGKQPTVIPLTKDQIDAVLRSLKVPVPVVKDSGSQVDATTQSSPAGQGEESGKEEETTTVEVWDPKEVNETTPVVTVSTKDNCGGKRMAPASETIPQEKRIKLDFPSPPTSEDDKSPFSSQENGTSSILKRKAVDECRPQRALHLTPEFSNPPEVISQVCVDGDLAFPLPGYDSTAESATVMEVVSAASSGTTDVQKFTIKTLPSAIQTPRTQTVAVQLPNRGPTILHLPVVNMTSQGKPLSQPVQILQGPGPQVAGQPVSMVLPCSFSPPLTPNSGPASPSVFTFPNSQSNITFTNVHLIQPSVVKVGPNSLIRPIATKPISTSNQSAHIVPPQLVTPTSLTPATYFSKTPGGFVPITSSLSSNVKVSLATAADPNEAVPAARKLDLADIRAFS